MRLNKFRSEKNRELLRESYTLKCEGCGTSLVSLVITDGNDNLSRQKAICPCGDSSFIKKFTGRVCADIICPIPHTVTVEQKDDLTIYRIERTNGN